MSINHYSMDLPETTSFWWTHPHHQQQQQQHPQPPNPTPSSWLNINTHRFNLNTHDLLDNTDDFETATTTTSEQPPTTSQQEEEEEEEEQESEQEAMFEKPLTPSDVGKLNRLVIPKQHAEKYFPLSASSSSANSVSASASDSGECKGLLLSFEDESGKCWRFRYSYWNSSQSYVLTKGWSRYVKDKRLDAGDVVSFLRHRGDSQRLFIRWRRRSGAAGAQVSSSGNGGVGGSGKGGVGEGWTSGFYCAQGSYPAHHHQQQLAYQPPQQHEAPLHAGPNQRTRAMGNCSSHSSSSSSKVLRLFGVNMEYQTQHHDHNNSGPSSTHEGAETNHDFYHNMVPQQPYYY